MAIKRKVGGRIRGLSTDSKPTAAAEPINTIFEETDTGKEFYNNGTAWVGTSTSARLAGHNKVYKIGSTYYAEKYDGSLITSSGTFETVLQASLDLQGVTFMNTPGTYTFSSAGVYIGQYTKLVVGGMTTIISPPASSAGFVCIRMGNHPTMTHDTRHAELIGARIRKGTGEQDWTAIEILSDSDLGNSFTVVQDVVMYYPGTGIKFISTNDGWISTCNISKTMIYYPVYGVEFVKGGSRDSPFRSVFDDVTVQSYAAGGASPPGARTLIGFKDVQHKDLAFRDCKVWDLQNPTLGQYTMTIAPVAYDIHIQGGTIGRNDLQFRIGDNSTQRATTINADDWNLPTYGTEPLTSSIFVRLGRRKGGWEPGAFAGWGMTSGAWTNHAVGGAGTPITIAYADGTVGHRFATGAVAGNGAGIRFPKLVTCAGWNPVYKIKFKLHGTSSHRIVFGWVGSTTVDASSDTFLNDLHGCVLGSRGVDTTFRILYNNGVGGQGATDTGITMDNTAIHTFELVSQDDITGNKWKYAIDGTWVQLPAGDIPTQEAGLAPYAQIATSTTSARGVDIYGVYVESK